MKNYKINRLKHKAELGTFKQYINGNGVPVNTFVVDREIWFGEYHVKITQKPYSNEPFRVQTQKLIVIRHDTTVKTSQIIKIENSCYRVIDMEPDDEVNGFDILTLTATSTTTNNNSDDAKMHGGEL